MVASLERLSIRKITQISPGPLVKFSRYICECVTPCEIPCHAAWPSARWKCKQTQVGGKGTLREISVLRSYRRWHGNPCALGTVMQYRSEFIFTQQYGWCFLPKPSRGTAVTGTMTILGLLRKTSIAY